MVFFIYLRRFKDFYCWYVEEWGGGQNNTFVRLKYFRGESVPPPNCATDTDHAELYKAN